MQTRGRQTSLNLDWLMDIASLARLPGALLVRCGAAHGARGRWGVLTSSTHHPQADRKALLVTGASVASLAEHHAVATTKHPQRVL